MKFLMAALLMVAGLAFPLTAEEAGSTPERVAQVLFVGDMMFDRDIRRIARERGGDFTLSCIKDELLAHDAVIGNLEGPVTSNESVTVGTLPGHPTHTQFTFPMTVPRMLAAHNVRAVTIGNNHVYDFGREGIGATADALKAAGIAFVGNPEDSENTSRELIVNHIPFVLVAYNQFFGSAEETVEHIKRFEEAVPVIIFAHWGDEYSEATAFQRALAREFVDAGADLVIGAHPHVIQEKEEYVDVPIYYSLGNFVFDQYWEERVRTGLALSVTLTPHGVKGIEEHTVRLESDRRTCPLEW